MSDGATTLVLQLRSSAKFSDEKDVRAQPIAESLARVIRPETNSPWSFLLSAVRGFDEVRSGTSSSPSGVKVVDQGTLEISLSRPFADFPLVLSHPGLIPISVTDGKFSCAGPYRVEVDPSGNGYRLRKWNSRTRNEAYAGAGKGLADRIELRSFETADEAYQAFQRGEIDAAPVPQSLVAGAAGQGGYVRSETVELTYLAMDVTKVPTDNAGVRRAVSLALDRLTIIDAAFGDERRPALRWLSSTDIQIPESCEENVRRISDPERSREILSQTGIDPASMVIPLYFKPGEVGRLVAQAIQVQIKDTLGIQIEPHPREGEEFSASIRERATAGLWLMTTNPELPIPALNIDPAFETGGGKNMFAYSNPSLDDLLTKARSSDRPSIADELYQDAEEILCEEMPAIPLWRGVRHWIFNPGKLELKGPAIDEFGSFVARNARPI